jgi:hypothetical protein
VTHNGHDGLLTKTRFAHKKAFITFTSKTAKLLLVVDF